MQTIVCPGSHRRRSRDRPHFHGLNGSSTKLGSVPPRQIPNFYGSPFDIGRNVSRSAPNGQSYPVTLPDEGARGMELKRAMSR
jgi:hypothetical protein